MSITYSGVEWDYNNLTGIGYDSETLLEPYATWFYQITNALNYEKENINLSLDDGSSSSSVYSQKEAVIKFSDYYRRFVTRRSDELINIDDNQNRFINKKLNESISIQDDIYRRLKRKTKDDIIYTLDECRYIVEDTSQHITITVEQIELSGATTIFDFELSTTPLSSEKFDSWCEDNCPINYSEIRPFIPGEYEYTDAYAGFRLTVPPTSGRFAVANSTVYVDVEDTVERGDTEITSNNIVKVDFSKRFYTTPHVITSLVFSNENSFIEVTEITRDYFKFGIKSVSTGNYVNGEITWLADGY